MNQDQDARNLIVYLIEAGHLKRSKRQGWWISGVRDPESVAEHSFRTAIIGYTLALMEGANADRTATLCVFHDMIECRLGDIPSTGKRYVSTTQAVKIVEDQTADLPTSLAQSIIGLTSQFEARDTPESMCAKDADKLECLLQAREYQSQGFQETQPWVDTMVAAVRTTSGKRLAEAALHVPVNAWWFNIVSSYGVQPAAPAETD